MCPIILPVEVQTYQSANRKQDSLISDFFSAQSEGSKQDLLLISIRKCLAKSATLIGAISAGREAEHRDIHSQHVSQVVDTEGIGQIVKRIARIGNGKPYLGLSAG